MKTISANNKKQTAVSALGKTLEEWDAIEQAERKTLRGKIKYAWEDFIYYPTYRFFDKIRGIPDEIKYFIQRGRRGYSDRDTWNIDYYLSSWMPQALKKMISYGNGYPGVGAANTPEKWKVIVKKIAKGFQASYKIGEFEYNTLTQKKRLQAVQEEGLKLFTKYFDNLWD